MDQLIKFFEYSHLPSKLQEISKPYSELAHNMYATLPSSAEATMALRKLLESKDCAVRAFMI